MVRVVKIRNLILLATVCWMCYGCPEKFPDDDLAIKLINNSNERIVYYSYITNPKDTSINIEFPWYDLDDDIISKQDSTMEFTTSTVVIKQFDLGYTKQFYIFNYDSIKTIPWSRIRDEYIVAKRVDFNTWEELEDADFTVTYP